MSKRNKGYNEETVVAQLNKKSDILIPKTEKVIQMLYGAQAKGDVGIKSKGKIDFLHKYCGYRIMWATSFRH